MGQIKTQESFINFCCKLKSRQQVIIVHSVHARRLRMQHRRRTPQQAVKSSPVLFERSFITKEDVDPAFHIYIRNMKVQLPLLLYLLQKHGPQEKTLSSYFVQK
jgi:hypothetical protein